MIASVLSGELSLSLLTVLRGGPSPGSWGSRSQAAAGLRCHEPNLGHLFFDELDAIGSQRGFANDVGERVLNSFLQMIGQDRSHGLVVAPTNRPDILDHALFRRFDDIFHHDLPDKSGSRRCRASREFPSGASGGASSPSSPSDLTARTVDEVRKDAVGHARIGESDI